MHDESADRISPTELFRCAGVCADLRGAGLLDFVADDALKRKTPRIAPEGPLLGGWGEPAHLF